MCGCNIPVNASQCQPNGASSMPNCFDVPYDTLCEGDGKCGTNNVLNNCQSADVYTKQPLGYGECGTLTPIDTSDCPADPDLVQCEHVGWGELCEGDGECGTNNDLENCIVGSQQFNVYRKYGPDPLISPSVNLKVSCWGKNSDGQTRVPALRDVTSISAGEFHNCAIHAAGSLVCWGRNDINNHPYNNGQTRVQGSMREVTSVSTGDSHTCAIDRHRTRCWSFFLQDQTRVPTTIGRVISVSAGNIYTCAINETNYLTCWGQHLRVPASIGKVTAVSAGSDFTCAINETSNLICWGLNRFGQATVPASIGVVTSVSAGYRHACAINETGNLICWGNNELGQTRVPASIGVVTSVSAGYFHTCAINEAGALTCWGENDWGQTRVAASIGVVTSVSVGYEHTCAMYISQPTAVPSMSPSTNSPTMGPSLYGPIPLTHS